MSSKFVPELYTLSKLIVAGSGYATINTEPLTTTAADDTAFANVDWAALGFNKAINNHTWLALTHNAAAVRDLRQPPPDRLHDPIARQRLFLLAIANDLARVMARSACQTLPGDYVKAHKLWHPTYAEDAGYAPKPIYDNSTLRKTLVLIQEAHDATRYLAPAGYGRNLMVKSTGEDVPNNLVPLLTHAVLIGKIYRALAASVTWTPDPLRATLNGVAVESVTEALSQWFGRLVMGIVKVPQQPQEADDLYIFEQVAKCRQLLVENYPDNVLFATDNSFLLLLPGETALDVHEMLKPYTDMSFHVELEIQKRPFAELGVWRDQNVHLTMLKELHKAVEQQKSEFEAELKQTLKHIATKDQPIRDLDQEIAELNKKISVLTSPPTREIYIARREQIITQKEQIQAEQQRLLQEQQDLETQITQAADELTHLTTEIQTTQTALQTYTTDSSISFASLYPREISDTPTITPPLCAVCQMRPATVEGEICATCAEIRQHGLQLPITKPWLEKGDTPLLWTYIQFDEKQLEDWLIAQFVYYVDELPGASPRQLFQLKSAPRLLPLIVDFAADYSQFLNDFELEILKLVGVRDCLRAADNLWILPQDGTNRAYQVLCRYLALLQQYFPELLVTTGTKKKSKASSATPLRLGLTITPAAQPFSSVWQSMYDLTRDITLYHVGERRLELNLTRAQELAGLDFTNPSGLSFLQFLSELADKPDSAAKIESALQAQKGKWKSDTALGKIVAVYNARRVTINELLDFYRICV